MKRTFPHLLLLAIMVACEMDVPAPPDAKFTAENAGCEAPCIVTFTSTTENATTLEWDFDDGSPTEKGSKVSHKFEYGKNFLVKLIAKNSEGLSDGVTQSVEVKAEPAKPAVAKFSVTLDKATPPATAKFKNEAQNAVRYEWDFGDPDSGNQNKSTEQEPTHIYTKAKKYTASLIAYNSDGKASTPYSKEIEVKDEAPTADFTIENDNCEAPCTVSFNATANNATSYSWDFGGDGTSDEKSPKHTFTKSGIYEVKLLVKGPGGEFPITKKVTIRAKTVSAFKISSELNLPNDIAVDPSGNVYVCGTSKGPTNFGNGKEITFSYLNHNFFVAKYNSSGECQWAYVQGGTGDNVATALALDNENNVYVTGAITGMPRVNGVSPQGGSDGFVAKLNGQTGGSMWFTSFGGPKDDIGKGLAFYQTPSGPRVYLAANITGDGSSLNIDFFNGIKTYAIDQDICFVFLDATTGQIKQPTVIRGSGPQAVAGLDVDSKGNAYLTGTFEQSMNFAGATSGAIRAWGKSDVFVAKWILNPGQFAWATRIGTFEDDYGAEIKVDQNGNAYATGVVRGQSADLTNNTTVSAVPDVFVAKLTDGGRIPWGLTGFNAYVEDFAGGLAITPAGKLLVTGAMKGSGNFPLQSSNAYQTNQNSFDMIVAEIDPSTGYSTNNFVRTAGGPNEDKGYAVCAAADGTVYVTGYFIGSGTFNGVELSGPQNSPNTYIVKYKP